MSNDELSNYHKTAHITTAGKGKFMEVSCTAVNLTPSWLSHFWLNNLAVFHWNWRCPKM